MSGLPATPGRPERPRARLPGSAPLPAGLRADLRQATTPHRLRQQRHRLLAVTLVVALALAGVVVAGGYGYAHWRFGQITSIDLPGLTKAPPPGKPQVVLVVGSDSRSELDQPGDAAKFGTTQDAGGVRSDVIMLVRLDPAAHTAKILSIPRDLLVPIAGTGERGKINAAFAGGPAQLIQTIQTQLGTPINHYLLVNFDGFRAIINTLGGIRLAFPYPAADAYSGLHVTRSGCQRLNGEQALSVARSRHYQYFKDGRWQADPLSDLGRIQRQQTFLRVVAQTGIARGLTNPVRANQFVGAVVHDLTKDSALSVSDAVALARQFRSFDPGQLANQTLPVVVANHYQSFGDVLLIKQPDATRAVASFLDQPPPTTTPSNAAGAPRGLRHHRRQRPTSQPHPDPLPDRPATGRPGHGPHHRRPGPAHPRPSPARRHAAAGARPRLPRRPPSAHPNQHQTTATRHLHPSHHQSRATTRFRPTTLLNRASTCSSTRAGTAPTVRPAGCRREGDAAQGGHRRRPKMVARGVVTTAGRRVTPVEAAST